MTRIVCQFSCGAASAVATKLMVAAFPTMRMRTVSELLIVNAFIQEEHPDNRRFAADCERWFEHPITVLRDEKYGASTHEIWRRRRFMKGQNGAICSMELKRKLLDAVRRPDDIVVFGFTAEEDDRLEDFKERFPHIDARAPLIERGLTKNDCLAMVERAGIALPAMYGLGFENANCIGCVKGGEGYWNKVRIVFPAEFEQIKSIQEDIGHGAYFFRNRKTGERFGLKDLDPAAGRHNEPAPSCSFFCDAAEQEYSP